MLSKLTALRSWWTACLLLFATIAFAQQRTISGKVTDANNAPVAGATVAVKGSNVATQTNAQGDYTLAVTGDNSVLVISFVGFEQREIAVGNQSALNISMVASSSNLNEVVVTGYTSQQRKNIVGAVATVSGAKLATIPSGNTEQQFQGRVPGVTVITSGQPGTTSQVRIRGFGSFSNNSPLYILDNGVQLYNIDFLNANDVESTTILKDAAAASIYGSRASAGVILITTKKGKWNSNKLNVTYDMVYGVSKPGDGLSLLTPQQQADLTWTALQAAGQTQTHPQYGSGTKPVLPDYIKAGSKDGVFAGDPALDMSLYNTNFEKGPIYQIIKANKAGTDWYDALTDPNPIQNHTLGISGGSENARFYGGFSYYDEQGVVLNAYLKKYNIRLNSEYKVKDFIRFGQNFNFTYRENPQVGGPAGENDIMFALTINPLIPVYDEGGGWGGTTAKGFNNSTQPVARRYRTKDNKGFAGIVVGNIFAEVDFLKNFTFRTTFAGYFGFFQNRFLNYRTYENSENVGSYTFGEGAGNAGGWTWTNTVKYSKVFGEHNLNVLAGIEAVADGYFRQLSGQGLNPFSVNPSYLTLTNTDNSGRQLNSGGQPTRQLYSQFGKVDYVYNDRYLLSATLRRDGASVFGEDNKYGVFPAFSAGLRLTEFDFMKEADFVNDLKVRGGWGEMGNSTPVPSSNAFSTAGSGATFGYDLTGSQTGISPGLALTGIGNPNAQWEANTTINIGFDGTFLNNKLDIIFDWYTRKTSELLFRQQLPGTLGTAQSPVVNIGAMENTGVDLMITYKDRLSSDFRFETDLIFTTYKNTITQVSDITDYFDINFTNRIGGGIVRNAVGEAVSSFYGYKVLGLFQSDAEVSSSPAQTGAAPGRFKYADVNNDKKIDADDRTYIGNPNPDFTYGFNVRLFFKNFDLEALFYGVQGGKVLNFTHWFLDFYPSFAGIGKSTSVLNAWTPTNTNTSIPKFENVSNFSTNAELNSYYVEDASYLRMRNLKIGYTIPANVLRKAGIERLRFFVQGTNLFTSTNYSGTDPEVSGVDTNFGVDIGNYPANKQFLFGLSLGL
jgi:TonB-dependent starch-binding outer membrane protein SusC